MRAAIAWLRTSGSQNFLDPKALGLLLAPTAIVVSVLSSSDGTWVSSLAWTFANLLAVLLVYFLVLGFRALRQKYLLDTQLSLFLVFLVSALIGAIKSLMTNIFVASLLGFSEIASDLAARALSGALAGAIAIPLVAAFAATRQELEVDRDALISRRMQRELRMRAIQEEESSLDSLIRELKSLRNKISRGRESGGGIQSQLALLKELAQSRVRPLSHRLFEELQNSFPQVGWQELLRAGAKGGPPTGFLVGLNLLTLPRNVEVLGLQFGVAYSFTTALLILLMLSGFGWVIQKLGISSLASTSFLIAVAVLASYAVAWLIYPPLGPNFWFIAIALVIWLGQSGLVFIVVRELFRLRAEAKSDFELSDETDSQIATGQIERGKLAQLLHGQVQSRLMSLSLQGNLGDRAKKALAIAELDQIIQLLSNPYEGATRSGNPMHELVLQWRGFLDVETRGLELIDSEQLLRLYPLIEEAVSNAYRHGLAQNVALEFALDQGALVLRVLDDGTGPRGGRPGIGSKLFDELSESWSVSTAPEGGSLLNFRL